MIPVMTHRALLALALAATPALADERFEALRQRAEPVESLSSFVERYVGVCKDPLQLAACQDNVKAARHSAQGKLFATVVSERARELLRVERRGSGFRFLITPFVDAGGIALTHGEPKADSKGRPAIGYLIVDSHPGVDEGTVEAALRTGRVELEILFRAEGAWKLRRRGEEGFYEGVKARFAAVRLVDGRTGTEIASKVL
jgi:hypothetical protein